MPINAANLASSANISAFNIGNAIGAALGAVLIAEGLPLRWLGLSAALVSFAGALVAIPTLRALSRQGASTKRSRAPAATRS